MRGRVLLNIAAFTVASVVMVGWALGNILSVDRLEDPYPLDIELAAAFGIVENAEVTYLGVSYGSVRSVERVPGGVVVHAKIKKGRRIPEGSVANVLRKSVIGEPYVDFSPPEGASGDGPFYASGARVPKERTTVPLEFSELLRSADALLASVPPEDVATLLREGSIALEGRAQSLQQLAAAGDRLSASLVARTDALDRLATNGTRITRVVTEHRRALGRSITDLRTIADSLKDASGDTTTFLDQGSRLLTQVADIVAKHKGNLDCDLKTLELVTDAANTDERLRGLRALLDIGPLAFERVWDATDVEPDGRWLRVGFIAQRDEPPKQYTPLRELPPVPAVGPCTSPLRPASIPGATSTAGGGAADSGGGAAGSLPATGAGGPVVAASLLLAATVAARRIRLRSAG